MLSLPIQAAVNWVNQNGWWLPESIDFICPHCGRMVNFGISNWRYANNEEVAQASAKCSGCRKKVRFWAIDPVKFGETVGRECAELAMHPTPKLQREPMKGLDKIPAPVAKAYVSAINVFNAQEWNATAMLAGRALEGLIKDLMPVEKKDKPLAKMLAELEHEVDLSKTLTTLVDGLRKGRNIAAHFDLDKEADQDISQMMINQLEYFLEYLYILPGQVKDLHDQL